jgi:hypothetical protein
MARRHSVTGRKTSERDQESGEQLAVNEAQRRGGPSRQVDGIDRQTSRINPDSAVDTRQDDGPGLGGSEQGGSAGPVGIFEGEGNEGAFAPQGGAPEKSAEDSRGSGQGGLASGAPDTTG